MDDLTFLSEIMPKIGFALFSGAIIGFEREMNKKTAGIKTNILICLGAAVFTAIAFQIAKTQGDPLRVPAQIVSGIGFLGAGAIMRRTNDKVSGLTTAAVIWLVAALGISCGAGYGITASVVALTVVSILYSLRYFERKYLYEKKSQAALQELNDKQ